MKKPLSGVHIVVTRARDQASGFASRLRADGARVLLCPTIKIVPPKNFTLLDKAIGNLSGTDWLVFTSANAVEIFAQRLNQLKAKIPKSLKTCAIGPATADRMREYKIHVGKISKEYVAESVLEVLKQVKGRRVLIPRAAVARDILPETLRKRGARVNVLEAYRTRVDRTGLPRLKEWLKKSRVDCVTFTSSSTVKNFFSLVGPKMGEQFVKNPKIRAASIGPITTGTLIEHRWKPQILAGKPTTRHLAEAIKNFYAKNRP